MKNKEVILNFLQMKNAKTLHLHTQHDGDKFTLINYQEPIAYITNKGDLWLNKCKYSATTSIIQNQLEYLAKQFDFHIIYYNEGKIERKGGAYYE